jgi:hypothetical protein
MATPGDDRSSKMRAPSLRDPVPVRHVTPYDRGLSIVK